MKKTVFPALRRSIKKEAAPPQSIHGRKLYREGKVIEQYTVIGR